MWVDHRFHLHIIEIYPYENFKLTISISYIQIFKLNGRSRINMCIFTPFHAYYLNIYFRSHVGICLKLLKYSLLDNLKK